MSDKFNDICFENGKKIYQHFNSLRLSHTYMHQYTILIGSENGLLPSQCQAIIWTNAGLMSIEPLQTYFSEILIKIQ